MAFRWDLSPTITTRSIFFDSLDKALDVYCNCEKAVLVGNFNDKIGETCLDFLFQYELQSRNKEPTCFKNAYNPSLQIFY